MKNEFLYSTEKVNKSKSSFDCLTLERYVYNYTPLVLLFVYLLIPTIVPGVNVSDSGY